MMTIRQAFEKYYDTADLRRSSYRKMLFEIGRWEQLTDDPDISEITNVTLAEFREAAIKAGYSPRTINGGWGTIRSILRRLGPQTDGNPWALGIIDRIPAMKPVKVTHRRPYRVPLDDLTKVYVACRHAEHPRAGVPPADWWRTLLVVAYTTGLRKADLLGLQWEQLDLEALTIDFTARKTGKSDLFPLHQAAVDHLARWRRKWGPVFRGSRASSGTFDFRFRKLQQAAGIERRFTLHDIRRTAASEMERSRAGLGVEFLQHAPRSVSDISYINRFDELREGLEAMRMPTGFRSGPQMATRAMQKIKQERLLLCADDFTPRQHDPEDWKFYPGGFRYRGCPYLMEQSMRWRLLKLLATSDVPVTCDQIQHHCKYRGRVTGAICQLRARLRELFGLPVEIDPLPCVSRGDGGAWTLAIP